jgi:tetratricopeptide (TPR) repeat protein
VGALAGGLFVAWAAIGGGYEPTTWYPGALFLLGLLVVAGLARGRGHPVPRPTAIAIACAFAFALWCFVSITWSEAQGDAWDGANRALLYALVFATFAILRWSGSTALAILGGYSLAVAALAGITLADVTAAADPALSFINDRLAEPTGYHNASAALYLAAVWPAVFLASRREVPSAVRGLFLAAAGVLVEVALLSQSRGSSIALPLALLVYAAVVPDRLRSLAPVIPLAAVCGIAAPTLLDVYSGAQDGGGLAGPLDDAGVAAAISVAALFALGTVVALIDRRWEPRGTIARGIRVGTTGAWILAAVTAAVAALIAIGNPVSWADDRWEDFKSGEQDLGESRFGGSLGTNRYDFWRVSFDEFADAPLGGMGIDQFAIPYLRERESPEEPTHPHSLPVRIATQTGIVGTLLFCAFLGAALYAALAARRAGRGDLARAAPAIAIASFAYWFVHASADWMWAFPALTAPAFAWLAIAGRVEDPDPALEGAGAPTGRKRSPVARFSLIAATAATALAAAASFFLPWGAARDLDEATAIWREDPATALDRLDRARDLNPLSERPDLVAGAIAVRLGDLDLAEDAYGRAIDRNPENWYALLERGAIEAVGGDYEHAEADLLAARDLNPGEPVIGPVLRGARAKHPFPLVEIDRLMLERVCARVGPTQDTESYCEE